MIAVRICKTSLVAATALFLFLVVLNNLLDYGSNYRFVEGVLNMETTFPDNKLMWRAVSSPTVHTAFYIAIILWEAASCVLCAWGTLNLVGALKADGVLFNRAKKVAICGLTLSLLQWYVAFITVGSEWFLIAPGSIPRSLLRTFNFEIWKLKCLGACPEDLYCGNPKCGTEGIQHFACLPSWVSASSFST